MRLAFSQTIADMGEIKTTYELAQAQVASYVRPIEPGMMMPPFDLKDEAGRWLRLSDDHLSGKPLLILLLNTRDATRINAWLETLSDLDTSLREQNFYVIVITTNSDADSNARLCRDKGLHWPMPSDATGRVFAGLGIHKDRGQSDRLLLVSPFRQILTWWDEPEQHAETIREAMQMMTDNTQPKDRLMPPHAPILAVPNVLTPSECASMIEAFENNSTFTVRPPKPEELRGDFKIPVYEHNRQDRVDCIIRDQRMLQFLDERIFGRVVPMVKKAFAFDVTRREDLHIARYVGERGGNQMGHRDNVSAPTAHRRFALSMNLNDDYEGGDVVFQEFDDRGYKSPAGTAVIFSSSLLHEVRETTSGTRYTLISHFFNEQSIQQRQA
ncbi:MAG: 2OG-Fe(II) oxygenase [Pseudomonadota bacterium]